MISQTMIYTQSTELLSGSFCFYFFSFSGLSALIIKCSITKNTVGSSILEIFILHLAYSCLLNCLRLLSKKRPKFGVDFLAKNKLVDTLEVGLRTVGQGTQVCIAVEAEKNSAFVDFHVS